MFTLHLHLLVLIYFSVKSLSMLYQWFKNSFVVEFSLLGKH